MPLAFNSLNCGRVAFGFFNIDSDMLLLENLFFFSTEFVAMLDRLNGFEEWLPGYQIQDQDMIGDLHGAIQGEAHWGFIGELYKRFPFPAKPELFRQKPEGEDTQDVVRPMIEAYGEPVKIPFLIHKEKNKISIGDYVFSREFFWELIHYLWRGGMPKWRDGIRPEYLLEFEKAAKDSEHWLYDGLEMR